jgi:hypothetical protein
MPHESLRVHHFAVHLLVPEADYAIAVLGERSCSSRILVPLVGMVTAVELDNQPLLDATQICEVGINAVLSPEFELAKALGSEVLP